MPANHVIAGPALARGLKNTFDNTWMRRYDGLQSRLGRVMEMGIQSTLITELYGYFETAPYPRFRKYGDAVESKPFRARTYEVENFSWDISIQWKQEDRIFDQLRGLERMARQAGENFATLPERIFFQIIRGASDPLLLPVIPGAPDGASIYSATDGSGSARFGVTGGNIVTGSGVATPDAVRSDFFDGLERFSQFQDPEGQPALDAGVIDGPVMIFFNVANWKVFAEAFVQGFTLQGGAAVTNVVLDSGVSVTLVPTQRLTDNDWYMFLENADPKSIFEQVAKPLTEVVQVEENSDISRRTKEEAIFWNTLRGYGVNLPLGTVQINNN